MDVRARVYRTRRRNAPLVVGLLVAALVAVAGPSFAAAGADPVHVAGTGTVGSGAATQTVTIDAQTFSEASATFTLTEGDPTTSPTPVEGTVSCVGNWNGVVSVGVVMGDGRQGVVAISDGTPTGDPDTLHFDFALGGPDCTSSYGLGTPLVSGDFTTGPLPCVASGPLPSSGFDLNNDFVADGLQPAGTLQGSFCDGSTSVPTYGSIVDTGGLDLYVSDSPDAAHGVVITVNDIPQPPAPSAGGASGPPGASPTPPPPTSPPVTALATFSTCGFTITLDPGSSTTVDCASVRLTVSAGVAHVILGDGLAVVSIPAGAAAEVSEANDGSFSVENIDPTGGPITLTVGGATTEVAPGTSTTTEAWSFKGFSVPVDNAPVRNVVNAGRAIPLRWQLSDASGQPVTTLTTAVIRVNGLDCSRGTATDLIEELAIGATGLKNLGHGSYEFVWKSPKSYGGSCRTLRLDIGDGVTHDALFEFTR